ncbi:hypothetical protein Bbelb_012870 [Branchiostoma belcheri]|nr:hypothetical protein Bbelb_012870 [Branchiostoma belcheri]
MGRADATDNEVNEAGIDPCLLPENIPEGSEDLPASAGTPWCPTNDVGGGLGVKPTVRLGKSAGCGRGGCYDGAGWFARVIAPRPSPRPVERKEFGPGSRPPSHRTISDSTVPRRQKKTPREELIHTGNALGDVL